MQFETSSIRSQICIHSIWRCLKSYARVAIVCLQSLMSVLFIGGLWDKQSAILQCIGLNHELAKTCCENVPCITSSMFMPSTCVLTDAKELIWHYFHDWSHNMFRGSAQVRGSHLLQASEQLSELKDGLQEMSWQWWRTPETAALALKWSTGSETDIGEVQQSEEGGIDLAKRGLIDKWSPWVKRRVENCWQATRLRFMTGSSKDGRTDNKQQQLLVLVGCSLRSFYLILYCLVCVSTTASLFSLP